jgi:glycosyltransferase involved in cell wall biosynthesis
MMLKEKPLIVVSAINIFQGGTMTVLKECLSALQESFSADYCIIVYVHKLELFKDDNYDNLILHELPKSRERWFYRLYYEFYYFKNIARKLKPFLWLSLHDTSPFLVNTTKQCVYCHNPAVFYTPKIQSIYYDLTHFLFTLFYKYLYQINITKNNYVIVQQDWIRAKFSEFYHLPLNKILVAYPHSVSNRPSSKTENKVKQENKTVFFYPAFPRTFKNFEIITEAVKLLRNRGIINFEVGLTIAGNENRYSKKIERISKGIQNINFMGKLSLSQVHQEYKNSDILLFPSLLETWGLPLSEFKSFHKPILAADLPYAYEAIGNYDQVSFFNPNDAKSLADKMALIILENESQPWQSISIKQPEEPFTNTWKDMIRFILDN